MGQDMTGNELEEIKKENSRLYESNQKLNERLIELYTLYSITRSLSLTLDIKEIFERTISLIHESLKVDEYCLMMIDEGTERLTIRAHHGMSDAILNNVNVSVGEGVSGRVAATGEPLLIQDISREDGFFYYPGSGINEGSFLGVPLKLKDQTVIGVLNAHKPEPNQFSEGDLRLFSAVAEHVSISLENAIAFQRTRELTNRDELTNLYNRRYFFERFDKEVERAKRYERTLSVMMIDIDHFKNYNDSFGHLKGDELLIQLSRLLEKNMRKADVIARYGGEEFLVMLPETDREAARVVAEKIRKVVEQHNFHHDRGELGPGSITITIGISSMPEDAEDALELLDRADKALYFGKAQGRNRVCAELPEGGL
jgi:diguanylate cyclase (GGDEF)-like protein